MLAACDRTYVLRRGPAEDCIGLALDEEDVRSFFKRFGHYVSVKDCGFIGSRKTKKPEGSCSDAYQARIPGCSVAVYIKFFVHKGVLIVSSFKDYDDDQ